MKYANGKISHLNEQGSFSKGGLPSTWMKVITSHTCKKSWEDASNRQTLSTYFQRISYNHN